MKKITDICFITIIFIILLGGLLKPFIKPKDINVLENRTAYQRPKFDLEKILNSEYQDGFELMLTDQIPLSGNLKLYNNTLKLVTLNTYNKVFSTSDFILMGKGTYLYNGKLVYKSTELSELKKQIDIKINNYNSVINSFPKLKYYLYYIETDADIDFSTNKKMGYYEYISSNIDSKVISSKFSVNNFKEYDKWFYDTDHHWNYQGSYRAYTEVMDLLGIDKIIDNKESKTICNKNSFSGSRSTQIGGHLLFRDDFCVYDLTIPEHDVYVNLEKVSSYRMSLDEFKKSKVMDYQTYYGHDYGLIEFDYRNNTKDNLLIIGESFDNAINELVASGFNKTYSVDLRNYTYGTKKTFNFRDFINKYDIDVVLFIGSQGFYKGDKFLINEGVK